MREAPCADPKEPSPTRQRRNPGADRAASAVEHVLHAVDDAVSNRRMPYRFTLNLAAP